MTKLNFFFCCICYLCPTNIIFHFVNAAFINNATHKLSFNAPNLQQFNLLRSWMSEDSLFTSLSSATNLSNCESKKQLVNSTLDNPFFYFFYSFSIVHFFSMCTYSKLLLDHSSVDVLSNEMHAHHV